MRCEHDHDYDRDDEPKTSDKLGRAGLAFLGSGAIIYGENLIDNQDPGNLVALGSVGAMVVGIALIGEMFRRDRVNSPK